MTSRIVDVLQTLPPRYLRLDERELVTEWLAAAGDVALAYVSDRRSDDPAIYRRIVIIERASSGPSYLIHAPASVDAWIVMRVGADQEANVCASLREALDSIRPSLLIRRLSPE